MTLIAKSAKHITLTIMLWIAVPATSQNVDASSQSLVAKYAQALNKILMIRHESAAQAQRMSQQDKPLLREQVKAATNDILRRYGFSAASFNQMTAAVERNPKLKRQVRQKIMRARIGF